ARSQSFGRRGSLRSARLQLCSATARGVSLVPRRRRGDPDLLGAKGERQGARDVRAMVETMRKHYDFSRSQKNPYARRLKKQVTIRLDSETLAYFKKLADEAKIPYQTLINMYLRDCAAQRKELRLEWRPSNS